MIPREGAKEAKGETMTGQIVTVNWNGTFREVLVKKVLRRARLMFVDYVTEEGQVIQNAACQLSAIVSEPSPPSPLRWKK